MSKIMGTIIITRDNLSLLEEQEIDRIIYQLMDTPDGVKKTTYSDNSYYKIDTRNDLDKVYDCLNELKSIHGNRLLSISIRWSERKPGSYRKTEFYYHVRDEPEKGICCKTEETKRHTDYI